MDVRRHDAWSRPGYAIGVRVDRLPVGHEAGSGLFPDPERPIQEVPMHRVSRPLIIALLLTALSSISGVSAEPGPTPGLVGPFEFVRTADLHHPRIGHTATLLS